MQLPDFLNLGTGFGKYFEAVPVIDDEQRRSVFRIRHAVYCEELGYEPVRPDRMEFDEFDTNAIHCLLRSVANAEYIGCIRLVLTDVRDRSTKLPFERLCAASLNREIVDPARLDRSQIAEVSRLAVISSYRRRRGEQKMPLGIHESDFGTPQRPRFPYVAAGLYLSMLAQARHHRLETLFMLTEPRLAKQLARLGVRLRTIGSPIEHRGIRHPSMMLVSEVIDGLSFFVRPLFAKIASEMEVAYSTSATKP